MILYNTYFKKLKEIAEQFPEYFKIIKTVTEIEYCKNQNTNDPFSRVYEKSQVETTIQHAFTIQGLASNNLLALFADKSPETIKFDDVNDEIRNNIKFIINYEHIINIFSKYKADPKQMFWMYIWAQQLKIEFDIKNIQHCSGLSYISNLKASLSDKIELLSRHIFTPERYEKIYHMPISKWGDIYRGRARTGWNSHFSRPYSVFHPGGNTNIFTPIPLLPLKNRQWDSSKTISVKAYNSKCSECGTYDELKMLPSLNMHYKMFLCNTCYGKKTQQYAETINIKIQTMPEDELIKTATNPYLSTDDMKMLSFHNNKNVRASLLLNPNLPEELFIVISLQNV